MIPEENLNFNPGLNLLRITQRRLRKVLGWSIVIFLIIFGLYGIFTLFLTGSLDQPEESFNVFYLSILTDIFLFYLWQHRREKIVEIKPLLPDKKTEISLFLDDSAQKSLEQAWLTCHGQGYHHLRPIHLFASFIKRKDFKKIIKRLDCSPEKVIAKTKNILSSSSFMSESAEEKNVLGPKISPDFERVFIEAYLFCLKENKKQIGSLDILWAISRQKNLVQMIFDEFGVSPEEIEQVIKWAQLEKKIGDWQRFFSWRRIIKPKGKLNRAMTAAITPLLDKVSQDLTALARDGRFGMIFGRDKEIEEIFNFLSLGKVGVVLVGESEIGKKSILQKIAQLMVEENVPKFLQDKRLVKLDIGNLVSLSGAREKGEEFLKRIIFEVTRATNIVLVMENVDSLVGLRSQESGLDFSEILASALDNNSFHFLSTSSPDKYSEKIERGILGRVLNKVNVALPPRDLLWQILISKLYRIEKENKIIFSVDAVNQAIDLADRYLYGQALPAKAIGLLEEAASSVKSQRGSGGLVEAKDILDLVGQKTSIPLGQIQKSEKEKLLNLEKIIHQRIIDQEEAVKAVAAAMRRSRLELREQKKTICNFLFIGPTGVGKTELSKTLAQVYFGDEKKMIRLDMSEYQEKRGIRRLIGMRGEEGSQGGYLTEAVKRQPYSILLLDEIEKAHPDILNLFLQVMDDGRLTDAAGQTINFTNIILIATSNAGTQFIQERIREAIDFQDIYRELKDKVLLEYFRPEFLNRFDRIVLFKSLSMENMIAITRLFLNSVRKGLIEKGVELEVEDEAVRELAQAGYDPLYGARPLRRVIQEKVEDGLAQLFLENKINRRDKLTLKQGLTFEIKKAPRI